MPPPPPEEAGFRWLLRGAQSALAEGPHPERAGPDAEALVIHLLRKSNPDRNRAWLIAHWDEALPAGIELQLKELVRRRMAGEPMQYIAGETEFYGLPFKVTS